MLVRSALTTNQSVFTPIGLVCAERISFTTNVSEDTVESYGIDV